MNASLEIPRAFRPLFQPARYKVFYGGRGGAKSWAFARALLILSLQKKIRVLCAREYQISIADSVHKLLKDQIEKMNLLNFFDVTKNSILSRTGSEFLFKGLRLNAPEIKSLEGVDVCWVEEAESVSRESWELLIPTIRKEQSEIWISFNPRRAEDETYKRFVLDPPAGAVVRKVGWEDNPFFPETLRIEKDNMKERDPELYAHIWGGEPRAIGAAQVFKDKYKIEVFETPKDARFFHGADWGFAQDPTALVRAFIKDGRLYVDAEAYGVGVELDETPALFESISTARTWPIKADCSRPETISFMKKRGFRISPAKKWPGSVEDGISYIKSLAPVIIHPRCVKTAEEFRLYSYKTDRNNGDVLPIVEDAHNHCVDALRYALDGYIRGRRPLAMNSGSF